MNNKRLSDEKIKSIIEMKKQGVGMRTIAKDLGINHSTVKSYVKKYYPNTIPGETQVGESPCGELNKVVDRMDTDGSLEVLTMDRPVKLEEMAKVYGLDRSKWVEQFLRTNIWEGFYKLRNWLPDAVIVELVKVVQDGGDAKDVRAKLMSTQVGHQKVKLYQTRAVYKKIVEDEVEEAIKKFVDTHVPPAPMKRLPHKQAFKELGDRKFVVSWAIWDAHLGMHAWRNEVGEDYDLNIARKRVINSIDDMTLELAPYCPFAEIWLAVGNDLTHTDSVRNQTTFGDHTLDVDTRYQKIVDAGLACQVHMCERALELTDKLDVMWIPGNHDYSTSYLICVALAAWFRNDPRVKVDLGASPRKYRVFGGTLVGFDHGKLRPEKYSLLMVTEGKKICPNPTYREMQIGHRHQRREMQYEGVTPTNGVLVRTNPALTNMDKWHYDNAFLGEEMKSVEAWRYDKVGYRGSHVCWARDD